MLHTVAMTAEAEQYYLIHHDDDCRCKSVFLTEVLVVE